MNSAYRFHVAVICTVFIGMMCIIASRLYFLQIMNFQFFSELANNQYKFRLTTRPERGTVFDRLGRPLALSCHNISAFTTPSNLKDRAALEALVSTEFPSAFNRLMANSAAHFCWIERNMSHERYEKFKNQTDLIFVEEPHRFYPFQEIKPIIGEVDIDNIGISGVELLFENSLKPVPRTVEIKRDARLQSSLYFDRSIIEAGSPGKNLTLSLDAVLQQLVHAELSTTVESFQAQEGAVLVMDPSNGEILVMDSVSTDTKEQVRNIPVVDCFEPGSSIKAFFTFAALAEQVVTLDEQIDCGGKEQYINGLLVKNWHPFFELPFTEVVRQSSNIGLVKVALRLGQNLYDYYKWFGFGTKTGIELPGERSGFVNPPANWSRWSNQVLSFGYEISVSLLQLAQAICVIANNGKFVQPTILLSEAGAPRPCTPARVSDPGPCATIQQTGGTPRSVTLNDACNMTKEILKGVGQKYPVEGCVTYGKTGTARCLKDGAYSSKYHLYTFVGVVERGDYKRVIVTYIKEPQRSDLYAAQITAPLFARVGTLVTRYEMCD